MSGFSIFGSSKPYTALNTASPAKSNFEDVQKKFVRTQPNYKSLDRIGKFDGYVVTFDRFASGIAYVNVNGKEFPVKAGSGSYEEIYKAVKLKIDSGQFASRISKVFCSVTKLEDNVTIIAGFPNTKPEDLPNLPVFNVKNKKTIVLSRDFSLDGIVQTAAHYCSRNGGKPYKNLKIYSHGASGQINVGNHWIKVQDLVERLCKSGLIAKGGTIEFRGCLVAQDFKGLKACAIKNGVKIIANNYIASEGEVLNPNRIYQGKPYRKFYEWAKVPTVPETVTYNFDGTVRGQKSGDITRKGIQFET